MWVELINSFALLSHLKLSSELLLPMLTWISSCAYIFLKGNNERRKIVKREILIWKESIHYQQKNKKKHLIKIKISSWHLLALLLWNKRRIFFFIRILHVWHRREYFKTRMKFFETSRRCQLSKEILTWISCLNNLEGEWSK